MPWPKGKPRSPETCKKMSLSMKGHRGWNKGRIVSEETRLKQSKAQQGRKHPEEVKQKIASAHRGKPQSEDTKRKLSEFRLGKEPWNKGIPCSDETRKKLSEVQRNLMTDERKKHLAELNRGKHHSEESKQKTSAALSGPNNPNWRGGSSFEPYCPKFNERTKEKIRNQYHRICQKCYEPENGRRLDVHHINFDKTAGCYGKPWNLVPLHLKCHTWTTTHRFEAFNLFINHWALNPEITI